MTDAPAHIWAFPTFKHGGYWQDHSFSERNEMHGHGIEYIRADVHERVVKNARNQALEEAAVEVSDWQAFTKHAREPITNEMVAAIRALSSDTQEGE